MDGLQYSNSTSTDESNLSSQIRKKRKLTDEDVFILSSSDEQSIITLSSDSSTASFNKQQDTDDPNWQCSMCTLENIASESTCCLCGNDKMPSIEKLRSKESELEVMPKKSQVKVKKEKTDGDLEESGASSLLFQDTPFSKEQSMVQPSNETILTLLRDNIPKTGLCKENPTGVQDSGMYIVATNDVNHLAEDGNGVYKNNGTFSWLFHNNKCIEGKHRKGKVPEQRGMTLLTRTYYTHQKYADVKRQIIHLSDWRNKVLNNLVVITYQFKNGPRTNMCAPHGNSKSHQGYTRVSRKVVESLVAKGGTKRALTEYISENGGIQNIPLVALPRQSQLYKKRPHTQRTSQQTDDFDYLMNVAKEKPNLVRHISSYPEPCFVLATDQQLNDLKRFASGDYAQPVTIDPTFNLGPFFVTPITYRNVFLQSKQSGCNGAFCGPLLMHYSKTKSAYQQLFSTLKTLRVQNLLAIGTDGEATLVEAIREAYPEAIHLRCFRHFEQNVLEKLNKCHLTVYKNQLREDLDRLVSCDEKDYYKICKEWTETWRLRDTQGIFTDYFAQRFNLIKDHLHSSVVAKACGRAEKFYTNASESINHRIKRFLDGKPQNVANFIKQMELFFQSEAQSADIGYARRSEKFDISIEYNHLFADKDIMNSSIKERREYFQKCQKMLPIKETDQTFRNCDFDVKPESCKISVHPDILRCMFVKAHTYLMTPSWITLAPPTHNSNETAFCVRSTSSNKFHQVCVRDGGEVTCSDCPSWKTNKICAHCIAVSHREGQLFSLIMWHRNHVNPIPSPHTQSVNLDKAGLKQNQAKSVRKTAPATAMPSLQTSLKDCPTDHDTDGLVKFVYLELHLRVKRCHGIGCSGNLQGERVALAAKIYRSYYNNQLKKHAYI